MGRNDRPAACAPAQGARAVPRGGGWLVAACACLAALLSLAAAPAAAREAGLERPSRAQAADSDDDGMARVIVRYRSGSTLANDGAPRHAQRLGRQLGLVMEDRHVLGARTQSLRASGIGSAALAAKLAARADVEWAVPVGRKTINAVTPNDPYFPDGQTTITPAVGQWYLRAPDSTAVAAINALGAWAITQGSPSIVVAVVDTGVRLDHPDLAGKLKPGYDFISNTTTAADGGGRDADPSDPGDYNPVPRSGCSTSNSSWHGTQVAGLIGAATDNGIGMAGTGRDTMVLPVRVLGRCGGFDDDIQAGMLWAAGLSNASGCTSASAVSATCNPNPAKVINLSLGSSGSCSAGYRLVINQLNAAGVHVVVAAGNDNGLAVNEPANCDGVIGVAGIRHAGTKVGYSNIGPEISIAAPAGNCVNTVGACLYPLLTTDNGGSTTPGNSTYSSSSAPSLGTSFSSPLVAGTVALMLAANPSLTPTQTRSLLQASARPFVGVGAASNGAGACQAPGVLEQIECYCTTTTCGAGMLDAGAAVARAAGLPVPPLAVFQLSNEQPTAGARIVLDGAPSSVSVTGRTWSVVSGGALARFDTGTTGVQAGLQTDTPGTVVVRLTTTDANGNTAASDRSFQVKSGPTAALQVAQPHPTVGAVIRLDAGGSLVAPGRSVASYGWALTGTTGARFTSATNASVATLVAEATGSDLEVSLTVTDSAGEKHTTSQTMEVSAAPVAAVSPAAQSVVAGGTVSLGATGSSVAPGHAIAAYAWTIVTGSELAQITAGATAATATLAANAAGTVVVRLTITDDAGSTSAADATVTVTPAPVVVTASGSGGGGGGGAMEVGWLLALTAAVGLLAALRCAPAAARVDRSTRRA